MAASSSAGEPKTTLPLWMYVATPSNPQETKTCFRSAITIELSPPIFTARRNATYLCMTRHPNRPDAPPALNYEQTRPPGRP